MNIQQEAQEIIENAKVAYGRGEISLEKLRDIWRRAEMDVELEEMAEAL